MKKEILFNKLIEVRTEEGKRLNMNTVLPVAIVGAPVSLVGLYVGAVALFDAVRILFQ